MKRAYLSIGCQSKERLTPEINTIREVLATQNIILFIFIDNYHFANKEEKQMMQMAFNEIKQSDLLIAEVSEKAIGVGIEIGYAVALTIPVIYLRNLLAEHSTTASGSANHTIIYENTADLSFQLLQALISLKNETIRLF